MVYDCEMQLIFFFKQLINILLNKVNKKTFTFVRWTNKSFTYWSQRKTTGKFYQNLISEEENNKSDQSKKIHVSW
jgi:hypothetical protein